MKAFHFLDKIRELALRSWQSYRKFGRESAVQTLEYELGEMENIFGLMVLGSFVGFPSPPMQITLDLLPEMEKHFLLMLNKVDMAEAPLSDLLSNFEVI